MLGWERFRPTALRLVPGALIGVTLATLVAFLLQLDVTRVNVPESIFSTVTSPTLADFTSLLTPQFVVTALAVAFIASAETLISAPRRWIACTMVCAPITTKSCARKASATFYAVPWVRCR